MRFSEQRERLAEAASLVRNYGLGVATVFFALATEASYDSRLMEPAGRYLIGAVAAQAVHCYFAQPSERE